MTNKKLIEKFKTSLEKVSKVLGVEPHKLTRDLWLKTAINGNIDRLNKRQLNELGGFSAARDLYFQPPALTKEELESIEKDKILDIYKSYVMKHGITPSIKTMNKMGITSSTITRLFGDRIDLYKAAEKEYPEIFSELVNDSIFTEDYFKQIKQNVKKHKRFIITTAVSGKRVDERFLASIKTHNEVEGSMLLIQPCEDVASRNSIFDWELDKALREYPVVFDELYLNNKLYLSNIKVSAKQVNPLTGLDRMAQAKGSMILASPKQYLKFVANSNQKTPRALMTTGALTKPDYSTDLSMSQRSSYIADFDHKLGGVIVEIQDDRIFHFRQIQVDEDGSFIDLGWRYRPDGKVEEVEESISIFGDTHVGSHDLQVDECLQEIVNYTNSKEIVVHDLFDCRFNNHHEMNKKATRAIIAMAGKSSMMKEGEITADWLNDWSKRVDKITIVKSNHDEALERYIDEGRWKDDPENLYYACDLVKKFIEGVDPLKHLIEEMIGLDNSEKINWLNRDEDYIIDGIENGAHGDLGANGSRGSLRNIESAYHKANVGHSHTAGIWREVFQVGTSTYRKLHYNRGPSSWTNTMCIQYPNGLRQLINIIRTKDGKTFWRLED